MNHIQWNLHRASYQGRLDIVRELLGEGADPNAPHDPHDSQWVCGPTALSKAIVASVLTDAYVAIVALLLAHGAHVDESHFADWNADAMGSELDQRILALLQAARPDLG